ncbi:MAG: hypothetical protein ACRC38_06825 [Plesiomonas sp.]
MSKVGSHHVVMPVASINADFADKPRTRQHIIAHEFMQLMLKEQTTLPHTATTLATALTSPDTRSSLQPHAVYRLLNGMLRGVQLGAQLTETGIQLALHCPNAAIYTRLRRLQPHLQRKLDRYGLPVTLNVMTTNETVFSENNRSPDQHNSPQDTFEDHM